MKIDTAYIQQQLNNLKINVSGTTTSSSGATASANSTQATTGIVSSSSGKNLASTTSTLSASNELLKQRKVIVDDLQNSSTLYYEKNKEGELELNKIIVSNATQRKQDLQLAKKNETSYDNIGARIKKLGEQGIIGKDAVTKFNNELQNANKIQNQLEKNKAFTQLNQQISDSKKQVMGLGEQLKTAYSKFANQILRPHTEMCVEKQCELQVNPKILHQNGM